MKKLSIIATFAFAAVFTTHAQFLELNISADCNQNLRAFPEGYAYPLGGTQIDVDGVPFGLSLLDNIPDTTGVIQTPADDPCYTFTVPSGTVATTLYTLMNMTWGNPGMDEGSIIVTGSHGETATLCLTGGVNTGGFYNALDAQPQSASKPLQLTQQELVLPYSFDDDTIASITFDGIDHGGTNNDPLLAGITLAVVPEPSSFLLIGLGALVFGARFARPFHRD
jgi:hypothetical protein